MGKRTLLPNRFFSFFLDMALLFPRTPQGAKSVAAGGERNAFLRKIRETTDRDFFCKCVGSATVGVGPNSEAAAAIFPDQVLLFERKREKMRWNYGILHSSFESCFSCLGLGRGGKGFRFLLSASASSSSMIDSNFEITFLLFSVCTCGK